MKTTVYTCDRCKQSKSEGDIVAIDTSYKIRSTGSYRHSVSANKDICKQCLDKLGLLVEMAKEDVDETMKKNTKTLEDKLLDILEDLGVMFCE